MRAISATLGLPVLAWVLLYLTSYGILVSSSQHGDPPSTLRCTYFIGTVFHSVDYDLARRQGCPWLWKFGQ